jgi:arabinogalactan oligomer/maltooligosaccharide transport system permease protein
VQLFTPVIDEAGRLEGLTPLGTFWGLVLPLAKPGVAVAAFY